MNLEELYKSFRTDQDCRDLLLQSHWFASFADFDPKTGQALPMSPEQGTRADVNT